MLKSAGLIITGVGVGVLAALVLRPASDQMRGANESVSDSSRGRSTSPASVRDEPDPSYESLIQTISELKIKVGQLETELRDSRIRSAPADTSGQRSATRVPAQDDTVTQLIEEGFTQDRAEWLEQRYGELVADTAEESWSAEAYARSSLAKLRSEIGDEEFARYRRALGQPTEVEVWDVIETSAAAVAGLQVGDRIVSYDGNRVFDSRELTGLSLEGPKGEAVIVNIIREGQPMQLVIPRGPLEATLNSGGNVRFIRPPPWVVSQD